MADVRSLLKNERAARRIQHRHASYSTTGTLLCTVCHLQLKSETLWEGHLRSAGHLMRLQKLENSSQEDQSLISNEDGNKKKRKASDGDDTIRKRTKGANALPEGFFDPEAEPESESEFLSIQVPPANEIQIPSRPATPSKPVEEVLKRTSVDDDEWAAFEADIAAAEVPNYDVMVISAPAMSAAELAAKGKEEDNKRMRERLEAELEGDKEDAARKLEDEMEEMEGLEQRVKRLREKREALRKKKPVAPETFPIQNKTEVEEEGEGDEDEDEEDDDDDGDDWDGFRMKG